MIKINKIDDKTIKVVRVVGSRETESLLPAMFIASSSDGKVVITTEAKWLSNITVNPVDAGDIYIDDVQQGDVQACITSLNSFIGSFRTGGGGVSPEVLKGYVREVPNPAIVGSEIVETNVTTGGYLTMGIASNHKTYFCGSNNGIKVLNKDTGVIENTNITTGAYWAVVIASDGKTYFCSDGRGIKVLNDETGVIEDTNITTGRYNAAGIASDDKTYFSSQDNGIKVLNDETGIIEDTNITTGSWWSVRIASNHKTYFCGSNNGIKVLNKDTGVIENTNITTGGYIGMGIASDGKTYFCGNNSSGVGIKVLNDDTGAIENTNIMSGGYWEMGIASNNRTYFCSVQNGIKVLDDDTGIIENTNITTGYYYVLGIASDGKTYFCSVQNGIKVLDDDTGIIEDTNITLGQYRAIGIASNGRTYFCSSANGIMVLQHTYSDEKYVRKFGEWLPAISPEDLNNLNNKDVAIYDNGEFKYVTLKDLDKDYHGLAADTYVDQKILEAQQRSFEFQGSVDAFEDLPADPKLGDVYYVTADDTDYYWNGTEWKAWQPEVDLSEYYKTTEVDTLLASKADNTPTFAEASSRTNIATGDSAVTMWGKIRKFFTDLKAVAFSGSYNDLTDKPNIDFQLNVEQKMGYKFLGQDVYAKLVKAVSPDVSSTGRGYSTAVTINEAAFFVNAHGFSTGDTVSSAYSQMVGYIKRTGGHRGNAATTSIEEAFSLEFGYGTTNRYLWVNWSTGYSTYMSGVQTAYIIVYYTKVAPVLP